MKNILDKLNLLAGYVVAVCAILILLITSIDINCFNKEFYHSEYKTLETAKSIGMTENDLNMATDTLLDYLQDKREDINLEIQLKGTKVSAFNSKEAAHMVDVKGLYQFALTLRSIASIVLLVSLAYLFARLRTGMFTLLSIDFMKTSILFAVFLIMVAGWAYVDFDAFWTTFHNIAFRNDLWLLDPNTDLMINMFPSEFFSSMLFRIVGVFASGFVVLFAGSYMYLRHKLHKVHTDLIDHE